MVRCIQVRGGRPGELPRYTSVGVYREEHYFNPLVASPELTEDQQVELVAAYVDGATRRELRAIYGWRVDRVLKGVLTTEQLIDRHLSLVKRKRKGWPGP